MSSIKNKAALCAVFLFMGEAKAALDPLSMSVLVHQAALASSGDEKALDNLKTAHRYCIAKEKDLELTSNLEAQVCLPVRRMLSLLDPEFLQTNKIEPRAEGSSQETFVEYASKYLGLVPGRSYTYRGRRKRLGEEHWEDSDEKLVHYVLKSEKTSQGIESLVLAELSEKGVLAQQTLITFVVAKNSVRMRKDVVINQPSAFDGGLTGRQDEVELFTPLSLSGKVSLDGYRAAASSQTVDTPAGKFSDCLIVNNLVEKYTFALDAGWAAIEYFDLIWTLSRRDFRYFDECAHLSGAELKSLTAAIFKYSKKRSVEEPKILSLRCVQPAEKIRLGLRAIERGKNPDEMLWRIRPEKHVINAVFVLCRKNPRDGLQNRYRVMEMKWILSGRNGERSWIPLKAFAEDDNP